MSQPETPGEAHRDRLLAQLADRERQIASLQAAHSGVLAASEDSNADDEHDPEGATIAFERQQLAALLAQAQAGRDGLQDALGRLAAGTYGTCQSCGGRIGDERLEARPEARTCITCAR